MNRLEFIQQIIDSKRAKVYLEIGVEGGDVFVKVKAKEKIAVDPRILITKKDKIKSIFRNISNLFNKYYQITSDEFFDTQASFFKNRLDIVFVDGLHTYEQSLRDVQNTLKLLNKNGVIVMHDCNPITEAAAHPAMSWEHAASLDLEGWTGEWSGDVWKTIAYLRSTRQDLNVFVLDCDCGLGIISKGKSEEMLDYSKEEIETLSYRNLHENRAKILNLKNSEYLKYFLGGL